MNETRPPAIAPLTLESSQKTEVTRADAQNDTPAAEGNATPSLFNVDQAVTSPAPTKTSDKRQRPGRLDIAAAKDSTKAVTELVKRFAGEATGAPTLSQPSTPKTAVSQASASPAFRQSQPRTVTLSKGEVQPASPSILTSATTSKQASRQPSVTSIHRPGTPLDERISDNASLTSTSISRASSPPPCKIGSAPIRKITKSQQKKERQARAKVADGVTNLEELAPRVDEVQAPIVGRKKKTKKEKTAGTAESTPTVTRPTSPLPMEEVEEEKPEPSAVPSTPIAETKKAISKENMEKESETPASGPSLVAGEQQKASLTPASLFAQLLKNGEIKASAAELFKSFPGINHRAEPLEPDLTSIDHSMLSEDDLRRLDCGEAAVLKRAPNENIIILPDRKILKGFTAEQASRFCELRKTALSNGKSPHSHALDGGILARAGALVATLAPAPSDTASATGISKRGSKPKQLVNHFATLTAGPTTKPSSGQKSATGSSAESANESLRKSWPITVEEAEHALSGSRKETEALEKKLNALLKKNKRLLFGNIH